eukprot:TRINITY_DN2973_c0_g2_i2.p1 TRINITY_DN2973_c0_g2~~TRINITY_DN2973_c0_g2_i2.p1  ORF type:complete len:608 (+),score=146.94 TRINITY_DN2973_c0_g2_i2:30-1826(+)
MDSDLRAFQLNVLKEFNRAASKDEQTFGKLRNFSFHVHAQALSDRSIRAPFENINIPDDASATEEPPRASIDSDLSSVRENPLAISRGSSSNIARSPSQSSVGSHSSASTALLFPGGDTIDEFEGSRTQVLEFLDRSDLTYPFLKLAVTEDQNKSRDEAHLFREEGGVGIPILAHLWNTREGLEFFKKAVEPVVMKIAQYDHALEIDPMRAKKGIRKNLDKLLRVVSDLLDGFYSIESLVKKELLDLFKEVGFGLSKRFKEVKIGSLICLRLICPMIVSPEKFIANYPGAGIPHTKRTLILAAKIIQRLANSTGDRPSEGSMKVADRFIRLNLRKWNSFAHKLMTGNDVVDSQTEMFVNETDFLNRSTLDVPAERSAAESLLLQQTEENLKKLLTLEKQPDWVCKKEKDGFKRYIKSFEGNKFIYKVECENAEGSLEEVMQWVRIRTDENPDNSFVESREILLDFSENLKVSRTIANLKPLNRREIVCLEYYEHLPEEQFGVACFCSTEREDVPITSKYVRMNLFTGYLIRGKTSSTSSVTYIGHSDAKGMFGKMPTGIAKMTVKVELSSFVKLFKAFNDQMRAKKAAGQKTEPQNVQ